MIISMSLEEKIYKEKILWEQICMSYVGVCEVACGSMLVGLSIPYNFKQ